MGSRSFPFHMLTIRIKVEERQGKDRSWREGLHLPVPAGRAAVESTWAGPAPHGGTAETRPGKPGKGRGFTPAGKAQRARAKDETRAAADPIGPPNHNPLQLAQATVGSVASRILSGSPLAPPASKTSRASFQRPRPAVFVEACREALRSPRRGHALPAQSPVRLSFNRTPGHVVVARFPSKTAPRQRCSSHPLAALGSRGTLEQVDYRR